MKLATLKTSDRDGRLVVVSRDLTLAAHAWAAPTMQVALEQWDQAAPKLAAVYDRLNGDDVPEEAFAFDPVQAAAPLPRAYQWLDASAFMSHGRLMQKAFGLAENPQADAVPLMYQGGSDDFLGARDDAPFLGETDGIDFEGEFALVLGDTPMGVTAADARKSVRLAMLVNDWSLRALGPREMASGFGFLQAKPSTAFGPVAVTPDELGEAWKDGRIQLPLEVRWNDKLFGRPTGAAMSFDFFQLIAHAAYSRRLRAGTVLGSGTVSNDDPENVGSACISEQRGIEMIASGGAAETGFMRFGDWVRMEVLGADGGSVFGAIEQKVVRAG